MTGHNVREDLARVCRILAHHGMLDLWGHLSLRVPKSDLILVTPQFNRHCLPRTITADDVLVCSADGAIVHGEGSLPLQFQVDLALYREADVHQACAFTAPQYALAAGMAGFQLRPYTHMESSVGYDAATWEHGGLALDAPQARALAARIAACTAVQQTGIGVWTGGKDIFDCLMQVYHLEYLAQANAVAPRIASPGIARADSDRLWHQFSGHAHYIEFFSALDPGPLVHPYPAWRDARLANVREHAELKAAMAYSCRALWERRTLVAFLEHISHRTPEPGRFLMTPAKIYRDMEPEDVTLLDFDANWIDGPKPPGFKYFHAQLLKERTDAQAVVHTHDVYGRVYAITGAPLTPACRIGLAIATKPMPAYPRCDLIVDAQVRRETLDALGCGPVVHEMGHGTDFVADSLEQATVDSIQREAFLELHHLAERFGTPRALNADTQAQLIKHDPTAEDWWWFYTAEVGAPRRSAAGL